MDQQPRRLKYAQPVYDSPLVTPIRPFAYIPPPPPPVIYIPSSRVHVPTLSNPNVTYFPVLPIHPLNYPLERSDPLNVPINNLYPRLN
jgi:hypothetical protein